MKTTELDFKKDLTHIGSKLAIDYTNSIITVQDHNRVMAERTSKLDRLCDAYTGKGHRRQQQVNESLVQGIEQTMKRVSQLTKATSHNTRSIIYLHEMLQSGFAEIEEFSRNVRSKFKQIEGIINQFKSEVDQKFIEISEEIGMVKLESRCALQIDWVVSKLHKLQVYSPAAQVFLSFQELYWGELGLYLKKYPNEITSHRLFEIAQNKIIQALKSQQISVGYHTFQEWLIPNETSDLDRLALEYSNQGCQELIQPMAYSVSKDYNDLSEDVLMQIPVEPSPERIVNTLSKEVFHGTHEIL